MGENGEKKSLKIRLSTVFLILALIIIGFLCCTIYIQKQDYAKQIAYLEDQITLMSTNSVSMQATIDNLEGKLGAIANVIAGDDAPAATNEVAKNEVVKEEVKNEVQTPTTTEAAVSAAASNAYLIRFILFSSFNHAPQKLRDLFCDSP